MERCSDADDQHQRQFGFAEAAPHKVRGCWLRLSLVSTSTWYGTCFRGEAAGGDSGQPFSRVLYSKDC